jgi:hypothetical protein
MSADKTMKYDTAKSVLKYEVVDEIKLKIQIFYNYQRLFLLKFRNFHYI